ncbi:4Fe-4S binding protein, partial [Candidatus Omnitrophota bacterium]
MKALVSDELCVGCGLCADVCPDVFAMEESKA